MHGSRPFNIRIFQAAFPWLSHMMQTSLRGDDQSRVPLCDLTHSLTLTRLDLWVNPWMEWTAAESRISELASDETTWTANTASFNQVVAGSIPARLTKSFPSHSRMRRR